MNRLEKAHCEIKAVFLCPERGENMDLSEIMKMSQEAIAGGENMELSEVMRLSQDAIAGQCERG